MSTLDRILFVKRLSLYLRSGIPLLDTLHMIRNSSSKGAMARITDSAISTLLEGAPLSRALRNFPRAFPPLTLQLIVVGETTGTLPEALSRLADVLTKRAALSRSIRQAFAYPLIIFISTCLLSLFLLLYAFPKIVPLLEGLHTELPLATRALIWMSSTGLEYGLLLSSILIVSLIGITYSIRNSPVKSLLHSILLRTPVMGKILRQYYLVSIFRMLETLLKSGIRLDAALILISDGIENSLYKKSLLQMEQGVLSGIPLTEAMQRFPNLYPLVLTQIIAAGEKTGTLSSSSRTVAELFEEQLQEHVESLSTLLEPLLMLFMGLIVGFIALATISPMYSLTQNFTPY